VAERLARAKEAGQLERQRQALARSIIDLSGDLEAAKADFSCYFCGLIAR